MKPAPIPRHLQIRSKSLTPAASSLFAWRAFWFQCSKLSGSTTSSIRDLLSNLGSKDKDEKIYKTKEVVCKIGGMPVEY